MTRRALPTLVMTALLAAAAVLALGRPNPGLAAEFFSGRNPTLEASLAVVALLLYGAVAVMVLLAIIQGIRAAEDAAAARPRPSRAAMFLLTGVIVLVVSVAQRIANPYPICCGSHPVDAQEAASLGH